jgi:hypothetical protein
MKKDSFFLHAWYFSFVKMPQNGGVGVTRLNGTLRNFEPNFDLCELSFVAKGMDLQTTLL